MKGNGLVIGAGIIGSAVAYALSKRGISGLRVLDVDLEGQWSSTERNAGGVRHLWVNRVNMDLARHTIAFLSEISSEVGFQEKGYLWLFSHETRADGEMALARALRNNLEYEKLTVAEIRQRYPFLDKTSDLAFGLFGPRDGLVNSNALKQYFRHQARSKGTVFEDRVWVQTLTEDASGIEVRGCVLESGEQATQRLRAPTPDAARNTKTWRADFVVLCAGAWMKHLLGSVLENPMVEPVRRQICFFKAPGLDLSPFGMVVDTSRIYFHAEGGNILAGLVLKDEKPGYRFDYDPDFFEGKLWPGLYERSTHFEHLREVSGWGGLYSYTPDTSGILGVVPGYRSIFEAHSFTGRGVMQSYGVAVAMADLILDGRFKEIDASGLTRGRFKEKKDTWLFEDMHI